MEKQWAVESAIRSSAEKRLKEFRGATLVGLSGTLCAAISQLFYFDKVSPWMLIILVSVALLAFLGESLIRYRMKNNLYGTNASEVRDIIGDITANQK